MLRRHLATRAPAGQVAVMLFTATEAQMLRAAVGCILSYLLAFRSCA